MASKFDKEMKRLQSRKINKNQVSALIRAYKKNTEKKSKRKTGVSKETLELSIDPADLSSLLFKIKTQELAYIQAKEDLKEFRVVRGFSIRQFAKYIGVSPTLLVFYESGQRTIPVAIATRMQALLFRLPLQPSKTS